MFDRIVFYGPINNNKRNDLIRKSKDYLRHNKGNDFFYILPNGNLLDKYKEILLRDMSGAFDLNLFTFDNIVDGLLEEGLYTNIDSEIKESILQKILKKLYKEGKIKYYRKMVSMEGFIKDISYIIGETKRSLITPEVFNEKIVDIPYYREIGLIYEEYERFLNDNKLIDAEESFFKSLNKLKKNEDYFKGLDFIIIDEFFDFRPQELEIIKEMSKYPIDIYINIPYKTDKEYKVIKDSLNFFRDMDFKIVEVKKEDENLFESIGNNLFSHKDNTLPKTDKVKLIKAPNKYLEIKRISQEIKTLYSNGISLNEIGIVISDSVEYSNILFNVFKEEGIPCSINEEIRLIDIPLVKEFLNIIKLRIDKFNKSSVIRRVKNSYFNIYTGREKDKIEYILYRLNYKDVYGLQSEIKKEKDKVLKLSQDEKTEEKHKDFNYMESSIETLINEGKLIPNSGDVKEIIEILIDIIDSYNIDGKVNQVYKEVEDYNIFYRDISALSKLKEVLQKIRIDIPLIHDEIDIEDFYDILLKYLEKEAIVGTLGNSEGVNILTLHTLRGLKIKALFIVGLVEGKYPNLKEENFFFTEENYWNLKRIGLNVKSFHEKFDKESLLFTIAVTRCIGSLYLTYPESSLQDEVNISSIFLDEFLGLFPDEKVQTIQLDMDYLIKDDLKEITTEEELINYLLYKYFEGEEMVKHLNILNSLDNNVLPEINEKIECEIYRNKEDFNKYNGFIEDDEIKKDLKLNERDSILSITYFETYGKCPYKFLMDRILNLEGMERFIEDFTPLEKGNIFHQILKEYYSFYREDMISHIKGEKIFQVERTLFEINERIKKIFKNNGIKTLDKLWEIRIENMSKTILNLIKKDLERMSNSKHKIIPYDFETGFGYMKDFSLDSGEEKVKILGRIDRIDRILDSDKYILYDYKTSSYGVKKIKDIKEGTSFQLPVYIMSQKDKNIIAGGYIDISKANVYMELVQEDEKKLVNKKRGKGILDRTNWEDLMKEVERNMKEYIGSIYEGDFSINPKLCDKYCPYREICRYELR